MEFSTIYDVCVVSSVICSVIDFKMVLTAYCKQRIIQLYFGRRISYGNVAKVLTGRVDGCCKVDTMLLLIFPIDKDVIHETNYTGEAFENLAHASLKVLWSTQYAEWHLVETNPTKGCDEGGQQVGTLGKGDLPESTVGV